MANQQDEIVPFEQADYEDMLEPGYRFSPTDSEIIVYYLKPMIKTGEHPECRLYQVNIYNHNPDELTERYRPCEDKWYFLTPRERKYDNGDRPNRITKDSGKWKMTQSFAVVYDDVSGLPIGKKNSFAYYVEKDCKTPWLMHEFTTLEPNLPATGSGQDRKKLTEWVICRIYKKERNQSANKKRKAIRNQEEENGEQNRYLDEPSPIRRRLSENQGINEPNEAVEKTLPVYRTKMNSNTQQVDNFEDLVSIQTPVINPTNVIEREVDESASSGNSSSIATNSFYLPDFASTSTSAAASQPLRSTLPVTSRDLPWDAVDLPTREEFAECFDPNAFFDEFNCPLWEQVDH